jgi:small-conductance mechanosensitive channel
MAPGASLPRMATSPGDHEMRTLFRRLVLVTALAVGLYVLFTVFNHRIFHGFTDIEVVLLEAGAVVLLAYFVARAVTAASSAVLVRRGQHQHGSTVRLFLNLLVAAVAAVALSDLAGVSAESIFLGSAFAGIVLGLAAQTVLANVFAGFLLVVANPFRPGDRVSLVNSTFGVLPPSYPHEAMLPSYTGVVEDVGLVYTVIGLDGGGTARVPNSVVLGSLVVQPRPGRARAYRVRMTFPLSVPPATVEAVLPGVEPGAPGSPTAVLPPRLEVTDLSPTTWDGVVVLWSTVTDEGQIRDRVLRAVHARLTSGAGPGGDEKARRPTP